jgi:hypothetical protein
MKLWSPWALVLAGALILAGSGCSRGGTNDTEPPSVPQNLAATALSSSTIHLAWGASTDDRRALGIGIGIEYYIYRGGNYYQGTTEVEFMDTELLPSTTYCYQISAVDASGNESALSAQQCATTRPNGSTTCALTVTKGGSGSGTVTGPGISCGTDCTEVIASGTSVTLAVTAAGGSTFSGWTGCDSVAGASCTVTMNAARAVTASFNASPGSYTLTVARSGAGSGTVTGPGISCGTDCTEVMTAGASATLTATAAGGSTFGGWSGCDSVAGASCTVTMSASRTVTASFNLNPVSYTLTVARSGAGSGTVTGPGISCGTDCTEVMTAGTGSTLTATAAGGSTFSGWSGCDSVAGASCTVTMNASRTVTASFSVATICTPGQKRCITGDIDAEETCNASGTAWTMSYCPGFSLCSQNACRTVCDMTATPLYPTLCMVPNGDGKNDGEWLMWSSSTLAVPTYADGRSVTGSGGYAPIYSSGLGWPYAWSISWQSMVELSFKLNQFGGYRHPHLFFKAKRSGIVNDGTNNYSVGVFNGSTMIASCIWGPVSYSWQTADCYVGFPYNQQLNYSGGWNTLGLSITGNGWGNGIDLLDVDYVYITIEP